MRSHNELSEVRLSVIIPTYNRKEILRKTLRAYRSQSSQREIVEILVVDDGSTDGTNSDAAEWSEGTVIPIRYLRQEKKGLAAARNFGIREARGGLVLFGDDDIIPGRDLVAEHLAWHKKYPDPSVCILGHVAWSPEVDPTPFMEWLGMDGVLFGFRSLAERSTRTFGLTASRILSSATDCKKRAPGCFTIPRRLGITISGCRSRTHWTARSRWRWHAAFSKQRKPAFTSLSWNVGSRPNRDVKWDAWWSGVWFELSLHWNCCSILISGCRGTSTGLSTIIMLRSSIAG
ncbi:MAG: glycosyltransferase family 2 protein [Nitrospirae bacterium]|nr:MAG: glycosyltransferase family 2 protein [Nitrospirota bacterium]